MGTELHANSSDHFASPFTRLGIGLEHPGDGLRMVGWSPFQHLFYCTRDTEKGYFSGQKNLSCDLIGGVKGDAVGSALLCRFVGQAQAGEAGEVRGLEVEVGK